MSLDKLWRFTNDFNFYVHVSYNFNNLYTLIIEFFSK